MILAPIGSVSCVCVRVCQLIAVGDSPDRPTDGNHLFQTCLRSSEMRFDLLPALAQGGSIVRLVSHVSLVGRWVCRRCPGQWRWPQPGSREVLAWSASALVDVRALANRIFLWLRVCFSAPVAACAQVRWWVAPAPMSDRRAACSNTLPGTGSAGWPPNAMDWNPFAGSSSMSRRRHAHFLALLEVGWWLGEARPPRLEKAAGRTRRLGTHVCVSSLLACDGMRNWTRRLVVVEVAGSARCTHVVEACRA